MTVASFPSHSYLPLDLMETDCSLIRKPLLTAPLDYSKPTWSFASMLPQERVPCIGLNWPVTYHLIESEAYSENSEHCTKCVLGILVLFCKQVIYNYSFVSF